MGQKLVPLGNRVLAKEIKDKTQAEKGGLLLSSDVSEEKTFRYEVMELGTGGEFEVEVGDTIVINRYSGSDVKFMDGGYKLIPTDDIMGVLLSV